MTEGKTIGNVNILDLRKTTEEAIAGIQRVGNVNIVLYSRTTASYVTRLNTGNINVSVEVPEEEDVRHIMGHFHLTTKLLANEDSPGFYVVMGHIFVEKGSDTGAPAGSLNGLSGLVVMGHVFCPESRCGLVQPKIKQQMGHFIPYPDDATLVSGTLNLTADFLEQLERPTGFFVTGSLRATEEIPEALLQKISYLKVRGSVLCAEKNAETIRAKLRGDAPHMTIVPSGFQFHEGDLMFNAATLEPLSGAKLFCTGDVRFGEDVTAEVIDASLASVRSLGMILCPEGLQDAVKTKLNLLEDRAVFYAGQLWLFDQDHTLHASRFEYTEGKITAVVTGNLRISEDVEPAVLAGRFAVVHNFGGISCTLEQMGAIEARLGIHQGELMENTEDEELNADIGNANILAL